MEDRAWNYAWRLLAKYGLDVAGWVVAIQPIPSEPGTKILGQCEYDVQAILLDEELIERAPWSLIRDVIRHEIAHALGSPGHGPHWQRRARKIGVRKENIARYRRF